MPIYLTKTEGHVLDRDDIMVNYEVDVISIVNGEIKEIGDKDIILGMYADGSAFVVLRWIAKRL